MKIDFTKFPCYTGIKKECRISQNIAESLADAIYEKVPGIAAGSLAHKIYAAKGETDLNEQEVSIIQNCTGLFPGMYADSINDFITEKQKEVKE